MTTNTPPSSTSQPSPEPSGPQPTLLQKSLRSSKAGFDKLWAAADKLGAPVNRWSNKIGSEAFWPTTLDRESDRAARILQSFCKDGFYEQAKGEKSAQGVPSGKQRVIKKIPEKVIREAKGLAIFTTMRSGLWVSGAGGSGVVVARKEDGTWSEPSGILLHTAGLGWLVGVDIYDCVLVLRTQRAVDAFTKMRWTVGGELSAVAGPVGVGGYFETEVHKRQAPIFTYLKSRGFYAGVQVDGTVVIERNDENARFYGERISCTNILAGKVRHPPKIELKMLRETLKAAQGDKVDESALPTGKAPADYEVEESGHVFGVPDREDPDPFGVRALELEGLKLKDAATHDPAPEEEFEFHPSEKSPIYPTYNKVKLQEMEQEKSGPVHRVPPPFEGPRSTASHRDSMASLGELARRSSSDAGTQTEDRDADAAPAVQPSEGVASFEPRPDTTKARPLSQQSAMKGPPPALPPRQQAQPIQMEDNEEVGGTEETNGMGSPTKVDTAEDPRDMLPLDTQETEQPASSSPSDTGPRGRNEQHVPGGFD